MTTAAPTGVPAHASPSPIPCFPWCDHAADLCGHQSAVARLPIPDGLNVARRELLEAAIAFDDYCDSPQLFLVHGADSATLSPEAAEEFANDLIAFAVNLRVMARQAVAREAVTA
jgi:uncharacterized protein DUF6907